MTLFLSVEVIFPPDCFISGVLEANSSTITWIMTSASFIWSLLLMNALAREQPFIQKVTI